MSKSNIKSCFWSIFQEYYFVGLYPAAVACIHDMYKTKRAGVNEETMVSQAQKFCEEIANVLNHKVSASFTNLCEVVFYDGEPLLKSPLEIIAFNMYYVIDLYSIN